MQVTEKPAVQTATQWKKDGDHPNVKSWNLPHPEPNTKCASCNRMMKKHGMMQEIGSWVAVCPDGWIVTNNGVDRAFTDAQFTAQFEPV